MQEAVSSHNLILTLGVNYVQCLFHMFTLQFIWGNDYVIIRGSCVIVDLMTSATWLANPSLLMISFPDGTRGFLAHIFEKMVVVIHI